MMDLQKLKRKVETLRSKRDRAQGAHDKAMEELQEEWDCETLEAAHELCDELEAKAEKAKDRYDKALERYESKWGGE